MPAETAGQGYEQAAVDGKKAEKTVWQVGKGLGTLRLMETRKLAVNVKRETASLFLARDKRGGFKDELA